MKKLLLGLVAVCALATTASAEDRRIEVNNYSGHTIEHIYISNVGSGVWGADLLGSDEIAPGQSEIVDAEDYSGYCMYDMRAVTSDGYQVFARRNICALINWNIYN